MNKDKALDICDKFIGFSFYLLAAAVTFSNAFTEIATFSIIGLWVISRVIRRDYDLPGGRLSYILIVFAIFNIASFVNTAYPGESIRGFFKVIKHILLFLAAIDYFNTGKRIERFLLFTLGVGLVISANGIAQYFTGTDIIRHRAINLLDSLYRVTSSFGHSNDFGAYLVVIITIFMGLFFSSRQPFRKRILLFIAILPLGCCMLATSSRGAWLALVIALLFLGIIRSRKLLALFLILLMISPIFLPAKVKRRFSDFATIRTSGTVWERTRLWSGAIKMIKEHPFLGFGVNTYTKNFPKFKPADYPDVIYTHNSYLQMAAEIGVIGTGFLLIFLLSLIISSLRAIRNFKKGLSRDLSLGLLAGVVGFLIQCAVDTHLYSVTLSAFLFLYLGLIAAFRNIAYEKRT